MDQNQAWNNLTKSETSASLKTLSSKFERFYRRYQKDIYRHVFFRIYRKEVAEEIVSESFMKFWNYVVRGGRVDNGRAFLYRIVNNMIIDYSRKRKEENIDLNDMLERKSFREPSYRENFAAGLERRELISHIKKLPKRYQQILYFRYFKDYQPREIAVIVGLTPNNVSVTINRAVKMLAEVSKQK